jgi:hypothetical protein
VRERGAGEKKKSPALDMGQKKGEKNKSCPYSYEYEYH